MRLTSYYSEHDVKKDCGELRDVLQSTEHGYFLTLGCGFEIWYSHRMYAKFDSARRLPISIMVGLQPEYRLSLVGWYSKGGIRLSDIKTSFHSIPSARETYARSNTSVDSLMSAHKRLAVPARIVKQVLCQLYLSRCSDLGKCLLGLEVGLNID